MSTTEKSTEDASAGTVTREAMYALVWAQPMLKVAARFGVSSSYMARVCRRMNVPTPERGYWAKSAVGRAPRGVPLPEAKPGDELVWTRDGGSVRVSRPLPKPPQRRVRRQPRIDVARVTSHSLMNGAKPLFEAGRLSYSVGYLKPAKRLLVDVIATKAGLEKALSFANELFLALEAKGFSVMIAPNSEPFARAVPEWRKDPEKSEPYENLWSPGRCTVVYIGTVAIGLTVVEMAEEVLARYVNGEYIRNEDYVPPKRDRYGTDHTWTTQKHFPTGKLCLHAYSPYQRAEWERQWCETGDGDLASLIPKIVNALGRDASHIAQLVEEGQRQAEIEHQRWLEQMARWDAEEMARRAAEAVKESRRELQQVIETWARTREIEMFFADVYQRLQSLPEEERKRLSDRLKRARELIGAPDALEELLRWKAPDER